MLSSFEGVITPDFSVYTDLPLAMQIWNTYRNRALAYWLQHCHIPIVPNVQWGDLPSYEFCFDGIAKGSTVAVSTNGCIKSIYDKHIFQCGFERMMNVISPQAVIVYSNMPESIFGKYIAQGVPIVNIENYHATVRKTAVHNG